jgi:thymidylate kinase
MTTSVLYSFSGPRGSGKSTLYGATEALFNKKFGSKLPVTFLGNVLGELPPPCDDHATTTLLKGWSNLNEACVRHVRPALARGRIVVVDQFGFDVYLNAVSCRDCREQQNEAFMLHHHHMVPARIVTQGIRPPIYFIRNHASTGNTVTLRTREQEEIERYFAPDTGQNPPRWLTARSVQECAEQAVDHILEALSSDEVQEALA